MLRAHGVSHFKSTEVEIKIDSLSPASKPHVAPSPSIQAAPVSSGSNAGDVLPKQAEIPHHINEVAKLLKLSDEDLVERLFPDPKPEAS